MRVSKLLGLVPSVIQESQITAQQLTDLVDLYKDDLPSLQLFFAEFERWKIKVQARIITADSCAASLKACDPDDFPNLYILLKIAATLPVTSCECEHSISAMRRLNNYMRRTMIPFSKRRVCKTFCVLNRYVSLCMNVPSQTEILLLTKNTCCFRLDRVWNIHGETTEKSIFSILDFKISWGSNCPKKPLEACAFGARSISRC